MKPLNESPSVDSPKELSKMCAILRENLRKVKQVLRELEHVYTKP